MTGVSPNTLGARRSDLASFGDKTWGVCNEITVVRRVIATLEHGSAALHELAVTWIEAERARGLAFVSLARRWSTLASLVRAIAEQIPRPRGMTAPALAPMAAPRVAVLDRAAVVAIVARCCDAAAFSDGAIVGVLGEIGTPIEHVAALRVAQLASATAGTRVSSWTHRAAAEVCRDRRPSAWAFPGRRRGSPLSARGVTIACERHGTTPAALIRCARGDP